MLIRATLLTLVMVVSIIDTPSALGNRPPAKCKDNTATTASESTAGHYDKVEELMFRIRYTAWQKARGQQRFAVTSKRGDALTIRPTNPESWNWGISEGYYLAIVLPVGATNDLQYRSTAALAQVQSVSRNRAVMLSLAPEAIKQIKKGQYLHLLRPPGSTTNDMRRIPNTARVKYIDLMSKLSADRRKAVIMADRMRTIARALHAHHELHGNLPPAVVYGPDGKPWHSWRMIIMGLIDDNQLINKYRFNEPWNSQYNRQFIEECPELFRFPDSKSGYTPFVVVTGKNTAFPAQGAKFDGTGSRLGPIYGSATSARSLEDIVDGWSHTILVGTVDLARKIPWTKPQDLKLTDKFPGIGKDGGFAAPFSANGEKYGLFLLADGAAIGLRASIKRDVFLRMLTINDGEAPPPFLPEVSVGRSVPSGVIIRFERNGNKSVCIIEEVDDDSE